MMPYCPWCEDCLEEGKHARICAEPDCFTHLDEMLDDDAKPITNNMYDHYLDTHPEKLGALHV